MVPAESPHARRLTGARLRCAPQCPARAKEMFHRKRNAKMFHVKHFREKFAGKPLAIITLLTLISDCARFLYMMTLRQLMETFPTNDSCKQFVLEHRWRDGVVRCPHCGNPSVYKLHTRPFHWLCKPCKNYRFSVISGTIFENTKYPLKTWFEVLWQILNSKKGVSALQIQRQIGSGAYKTAWYMCHRLRASMKDPEFKQLMGIVEVDEAYIGGKQENRHWKDRQKYRGGGAAHTGKTTVIGAISRKGNVVCQIIEDTSADTLSGFVETAVSEKVTLIATDEWGGYRDLRHFFPHEVVRHSAGEYVRGEVHTNNIESFWSLLKRGVIGTYHHVSKKYLPLYLAEFQFRFNNRNNDDIFGEAIGGC
jgi:transposase-like protein